jgi:hypothetical protein
LSSRKVSGEVNKDSYIIDNIHNDERRSNFLSFLSLISIVFARLVLEVFDPGIGSVHIKNNLATPGQVQLNVSAQAE